MHGKGPKILDVNWIFATPKLKRIQCSMWKSIIGAWMKVRPGLAKADPTSTVEILRQPIFGNLMVLNDRRTPLGVSGLSEGSAFVRAGCIRTKDLWNPGEQKWKSLTELGMSQHASNKKCKDSIIASILWQLSKSTSPLRNGD